MAKKQFKAESKRLLDLMINSIYTHKEIFLREIISNASDALDKLAYLSLTDDKVGLKRKDFQIKIIPNKENRTLTVSDNGIGMTKEELRTTWAPSPRAAPANSRRTCPAGRRRPRPRWTSSGSSAWASTPPSWSPTR